MTDQGLTDKELAEIRERCDAATKKPWVRFGRYVVQVDDTRSSLMIFESGVSTRLSHESNCIFTAHARADVPRLLDEVERLRAEKRMLRELLR